MKTFKTIVICLFLFLPVMSFAEEKEAVKEKVKEPPKKIGLDIGLDYWSDYYYRGQSFYGAGKGALFPWIGYGIKGFYFSIVGEIDVESLGDQEQRGGQEWYGIDYYISYYATIAKKLLTIGGHLAYFMYPASYNLTGSEYLKDLFSLLNHFF